MNSPNEESGLIVDARFLVIGCGSIGKRHLLNLKQLGVMDIIAFDPRADRRQEVEQRFQVPTYATLDSAFGEHPSVALICSPTHLHIEHALLAAQAGCHLFIEKPIAATNDGIDRLIREVDRQSLYTLVGCNFRFHPGLRKIKALLDSCSIGPIISARAQFGQYLPDWHPWEDYRQNYSAQRSMGGGVVLDRIHEIDYLRWLLGEVSEVFAFLGKLSHLEIDTEDIAEILLRFQTGAIGSIHLDYIRRRYDCSLEIIGENGIVKWLYQDQTLLWYSTAESIWQTLRWPEYEANEMYLAEMKHFLHVLAGEEVPELEVTGAAIDLKIASACKRAAFEHRVIKI